MFCNGSQFKKIMMFQVKRIIFFNLKNLCFQVKRTIFTTREPLPDVLQWFQIWKIYVSGETDHFFTIWKIYVFR